MAERNTPLVNALLNAVSEHPDFEQWQRKGTLPDKAIKDLCKLLKSSYPNQPARLFTSAEVRVKFIYDAWFATQKKYHQRLTGKQRWLDIVKSDSELVNLSNSSLSVLQQKAQDILNQFNAVPETLAEETQQSQSKQQQRPIHKNRSLISHLFAAYDAAQDTLSQCAIAYLIKNNGTIPEDAEDVEEFTHKIHAQQEAVKKLKDRLQARLPRGRDINGNEFLKTLMTATEEVPTDEQLRAWEVDLMTRSAVLPYPIFYGSATDISWGKTASGRIGVDFNGIKKYLKSADPSLQTWLKSYQEPIFQVYCDQRQLPYFQRFFEDWQSYKADQQNYPAGLLTLRSVTLCWRKGKGKGEPWNVHHLSIHCSLDTRLMSAEGTLQIQKEKLDKAANHLNRAVPDENATEAQKKFYQRTASTQNRLNHLPVRPSRKPYQGNPEILVGISVGLVDPVTVAVVNGRTGKVLTYRTGSTLLGDRYHLFNRHCQKSRQNSLKRHQNQKRGISAQPSESNLGQYLDRLLAKEIIQLAQKYQAASIVVPNLAHLREILSAEICAKAAQKCPGSVEAQKKYAKQYQMLIHKWSYRRLLDSIQGRANQAGLMIESGFQASSGDSKKQAKEIALAAYHSRLIPENSNSI